MITITPVKSTPKFPAAYKLIKPENQKVNLIVLFFAEKEGVVIEASGNVVARYVGEKTDNLISCFDATQWQPVNISITHNS